MSTVPFINCFEVPAGKDDEFLAFWLGINAHMRVKPGYVSHRLHRSLDAGARFRYVNVAEWTSAEAWEAAHDAEFAALLATSEFRDFVSIPGLYEVVHTGHVAPVG